MYVTYAVQVSLRFLYSREPRGIEMCPSLYIVLQNTSERGVRRLCGTKKYTIRTRRKSEPCCWRRQPASTYNEPILVTSDSLEGKYFQPYPSTPLSHRLIKTPVHRHITVPSFAYNMHCL